VIRLDRELAAGDQVAALVRQFACKEAVCAVKIRNPRLILSELVIHTLTEREAMPGTGVGEAAAYLSALNHGLLVPSELLLAADTLRALRALIVANDAGQRDRAQEFRTVRRWNPPVPAPHDGPICRAATAVAEIAALRPFATGNSRLARLLALLLLASAFPRPGVVLHPSLYFTRHWTRARQFLVDGGAVQDPQPWIEFFAGAITSSARAAFATVRRLERLGSADAASIGTRYAAASAIRVHAALRGHPVASIDRVLEASGLRVQSAMRAVHRLRALGIVREITGRTRHRIFSYHQYARILGEGTEII
jgi:hypothetical protein